MKNLMILLFSATCLFAIACNGAKKTTDKEAKVEETALKVMPDLTISIKKGQCFGRCPVFDFSISGDGSATYYGRRFVDVLGKYKGEVSADNFKRISAMWTAAKAEGLEETYRSGATDLPTHSLIIAVDTIETSVRGDHTLPESVKAIIAEMDSLKNTIEWTMTEANVPRDRVLGEILVDVTPDADFDKIAAAFAKYDLKMDRQIAPNMSMYVLTHNPDIENPGVLVAELMQLPEIKTAQFNQKVTPRDH